ncbi:MAG: KTSC domain-containing protein [Crocinitomicaceae bacterium]|nr:KTSC domain-containing protein [Crocinitomicaceae bacterium]
MKWIDYIADMEILVVKFKNSRVYYMYFDVPEAVYQKFKLSESPGRFVHQYLAGYKYDSFDKYADWLNVYQSVREITNSIE